MLRGYERSLGWALRHSRLVALVLLATVGLNVFLFVIIPKGFFPQEDTGRMIGGIQADQSISFQSMRQKLAQFEGIVQADPAVGSVVGFTGGRQTNSGFVFISLKPLAQRHLSADRVIARLRPKLAQGRGRAGCSCRWPRTSASAAGRATRSTSTRCRPTTRRRCTSGRRSSPPPCSIRQTSRTSTPTSSKAAWRPT